MEAEDGEVPVRSPLKVLYMHGGGANPATSYKAQYLMKHFDCSCPHMVNTSFYDDCRRLQCATLRTSLASRPLPLPFLSSSHTP
jgi:hypothetical protein